MLLQRGLLLRAVSVQASHIDFEILGLEEVALGDLQRVLKAAAPRQGSSGTQWLALKGIKLAELARFKQPGSATMQVE